SRAIRPIENTRKNLGTDHQNALRLPRANKSIGRAQGINKAAADCLHIKGSSLNGLDIVLYQTSSTGKNHIRGRGRHDNEIERISTNSSALKRLLRCACS